MPPKPDHETLLPPSSSTAASFDQAPTTTSAEAVNSSHNLATDDPPDSFWLSQDAELDWIHRNAFLDRNHSTRANQSQHQSSIPISHKFQSKNSNASIIWIPKPQRRSSFPESKRAHHHHREVIRLVPKRNDPTRTEPSSPKVSCTGRVRLKSNQSTKKKKKERKKKKSTTESRPETPRMKSGSSGLWKRLRQVFRSGKLKKAAALAVFEEGEIPAEMRMRSRSCRKQSSSMIEPLTEPVLNSLNRFASGRKSDLWIDELRDAIEEVDVMECKKLGIGGLWRRRNIEALEEVDCGRDWLVAGPASV